MSTTYRIEPLPDRKDSPQWRHSTIGAKVVFVSAEDEEAARELVALKVNCAARSLLGDDSPLQPYLDPGFSTCVRDDSMQMGENEIRGDDGEIIVTDE